jgi:agmatine deiminase
MAWPPVGYLTEGGDDDAAYMAWSNVANAVVRFEPVTMVVVPGEENIAAEYLDPKVEIVCAPLDDAWMRDMGPTFVKNEAGEISGVNWIFNGWGAQEWASWDNDEHIAEFVCQTADQKIIDSPLINEGGGIHVNGKGTILLTETVQRGLGRNSAWSRERIQEEFTRTLGATDFIWFERGLTRDYDTFGTRGHVDIVACFADENTILYHDQQNPEHPDFEVSQEVRELLATRPEFKAIGVPAPLTLRDEEGWVDYSYINHYICNGAVILCAFDDENDQVAKSILESAYPGREIVLVDAREIFARGGGIHCITQQQPA